MRIFLAFFICLISISSSAQSGGMFWNKYAYFNPALTGLKYHHQAYLDYRSEAVKASRMPKDLFANYALNFEKIKLSLGATYDHSELGFIQGDKAILNLSYEFKLGEKVKLSLGANGGIHIRNFDAITAGMDDTDTWKSTDFVLDAGIAIHSEKFMIGIGSININNMNVTVTSDSILGSSGPFALPNSYNNFVEYDWALTKKLSLMPRLMVATDFVTTVVDINAQLQYNKKYMISFGFRTTGSLVLGANWDAKKKFRVG
jgi:type IX secretion system PorP/SprF family membrane protein